MPRTSADQCPPSPQLDRIGSSTAEYWAIAGCANAARARRAPKFARADYRPNLTDGDAPLHGHEPWATIRQSSP